MKRTWLFNQGDLVKIKTGLFAGREGRIIEAMAPMMDPDWPWDHYWLTVQTRSFDGSKVLVHLESKDVELSATSTTDG